MDEQQSGRPGAETEDRDGHAHLIGASLRRRGGGQQEESEPW